MSFSNSMSNTGDAGANPLSSPGDGTAKLQRRIAATRAAAAVLWAVVYAIAVHGEHVLSVADVPVLAGVLVAIYPAIDAVASVRALRSDVGTPELRVGLAFDLLAIAGLFVATFGLQSKWVIVAFGAWALAAGLLQLAGAVRAGRPRRAQVPLMLSGGISTVVGATFLGMGSQHEAHLSNLVGYPVLGAVFFLVYAAIDLPRRRTQPQSAH